MIWLEKIYAQNKTSLLGQFKKPPPLQPILDLPSAALLMGCKRMGISKDNVEMLCECVHAVARVCGADLDRMSDGHTNHRGGHIAWTF